MHRAIIQLLCIQFLFLATTANLRAQIPHPTKIAEKERFSCGSLSFREFVQKRLNYTADAFQERIYGILLAGIDILPNGEVNQVYLLNSLYPSIDNMVLDVLESTAGCWKPLPDTLQGTMQHFTLPIVMKFEGMELGLSSEYTPAHILDEVGLTLFGIARGSGAHTVSLLESVEKVVKKAEKQLEKRQYDKVLDYANELLKRDPVNPHYYLLRIQAYMGMGKLTPACQDARFVSAFLRYDYHDRLQLDCTRESR